MQLKDSIVGIVQTSIEQESLSIGVAQLMPGSVTQSCFGRQLKCTLCVPATVYHIYAMTVITKPISENKLDKPLEKGLLACVDGETVS